MDGSNMNGLQLCEQYFKECALPVLQRECPKLLDTMTVGLAGEGSECFGFDDQYSRDHDWGPGFCIWLDQEDYKKFYPDLQKLYDGLPKHFKGYGARQGSRWGEGRIGVIETSAFYTKHLGIPGIPRSAKEWLLIPEIGFAAAINGKIFLDGQRQFSEIRATLKSGYPEDIRRKKIAARCMTAGQAGQYNVARSLKRKELYATRQAEMKFLEMILSLTFLLNNQYVPFYKWAHRAVKHLPLIGQEIFDMTNRLLNAHTDKQKLPEIEEISRTLINQLRTQGLSNHGSDFLPDHGPEVQATITDSEVRNYNIMAG